MKPAYIPDILRTPIGRYGGSLAKVRPDDLAALVIKSLLDRNPGVDPKEIEDVIFGAANQAGEDNRNVARMALLIAVKAFVAQSIACIRDLDLDPDIVNVNGGAIALGHPLGCSGTRISATLIHKMQKRPKVKYGLTTMCIGVGQGAAVIYEKC